MVEIAPYSAIHQSGIVDVILPIQQSEFGIPVTLDDQPDLLDIPGFYQKGSGNFWVALHEREVIGTLRCSTLATIREHCEKCSSKSRSEVRHWVLQTNSCVLCSNGAGPVA